MLLVLKRTARSEPRLQHHRINPFNSRSHLRTSRLCRAVRWRAVLINLLSVQTPRNAVELDVGALNFAMLIESQEIETLHPILTRSDLWEQPLPHNLVA
jgi:hypothetical protein